MKRRPLPKTPAQWLREVKEALQEANESTDLSGPWAANLFQVGPFICFRFRRLELSEEEQERVVRLVFAHAIVTDGPKNGIKYAQTRPKLAFALCFIATHIVLKYLNDTQATKIIRHCERSMKDLVKA